MNGKPAAIVALAALALTGPRGALAMGSLGGGTIRPPADFDARLIDRDGTEVTLHRVNINGRVSLPGRLGRGEVKVPFENISAVEFRQGGPGQTAAVVRLREGEPVTLQVRESLRIYGQTRVGLYEIRARDVRRIEIRPARPDS